MVSKTHRRELLWTQPFPTSFPFWLQRALSAEPRPGLQPPTRRQLIQKERNSDSCDTRERERDLISLGSFCWLVPSATLPKAPGAFERAAPAGIGGENIESYILVCVLDSGRSTWALIRFLCASRVLDCTKDVDASSPGVCRWQRASLGIKFIDTLQLCE